ncbi:MAG: DUF2007 domain-containing protein [Bacteroidales bacterium]|nr:DUF2007 domain-containing protein [Bacteroidales bacterium]
MTKEIIKLVYTGSRVEAMFLKELLEKNQIGCIFKDALGASVSAGWADGSPEDGARIYVEPQNEEKAKTLLKEYFDSRDK